MTASMTLRNDEREKGREDSKEVRKPTGTLGGYQKRKRKESIRPIPWGSFIGGVKGGNKNGKPRGVYLGERQLKLGSEECKMKKANLRKTISK